MMGRKGCWSGSPALPQTSWETVSMSWEASMSTSASVLLDWIVSKSLSEPEILYVH